ncbi:P22 coat - protein 5 family protein [Tardibacter chloracetimidivorans]|uniref:P22 coat-protein 5 family protein n=1 Tax=Tardibacter chloracetimidivorans TaxID=1921510 RepID=A0A1L3ZR36_9SPHN|nr:P22 coat - protein 5 family protein [Tardibacter chloracetimidivorans]API58091.1 P22 coat - protein 5 family protein [Tardibacter chloracetimidivorans]
MAVNTITDLIPDLYNALDVVSRELVGFIPAVSSDLTFERAAVGQTVRSPVAPASTASDITPAVTPPDDGEQTIGNVDMTIQKARRVPVRWNGEQSLGLNNNGPTRSRIMVDQFAQAMRTLCNEVEGDLAALHIAASRAYGTAAQTPFGTAGDFSDASNVLKILKDNGNASDAQLVIDTTAGAKLLGLQSRYDIAGDTIMQNQGIIVNKAGLMLRESAAVKTSTAGTMSGGTVATGSYAVGATVLSLKNATGTGACVAGDVITIADDTNKYVVASVSQAGANPATGDTITLAAPGLRKAISGEKVITVIAAAARNMAFTRSAIALATRAPALPVEGDSASDREIVSDPRSGLSFEVSMYKQYRQVQYEVALAWGVKAVKSEHIALLLG